MSVDAGPRFEKWILWVLFYIPLSFSVVILIMFALHVAGTAQWNSKLAQFSIRNRGFPDAILKWRIRISTSLKRLEKCLFGQFELLLYHWDRDSVLYFRIRQIHEDWWRLSSCCSSAPYILSTQVYDSSHSSTSALKNMQLR